MPRMPSTPRGTRLRQATLSTSQRVLLVVDFITTLDCPGAEKLAPHARATACATAALVQRLHGEGVATLFANDNDGVWQSDFHSLVSTGLGLPGEAGEIARVLSLSAGRDDIRSSSPATAPSMRRRRPRPKSRPPPGSPAFPCPARGLRWRRGDSVSLGTIIHAGLVRPDRSVAALVLMGGGARTAYQVGVLKALATMLRAQRPFEEDFPFQVLVGTSAGAINAAFVAGRAAQGLRAFDDLATFWSRLRSQRVYRLHMAPWLQVSRLAVAVNLWARARTDGAVLDTMPLVDTLHGAVDLAGIDTALEQGALDSVAVTASSYTSGVHWTFCHAGEDRWREPWNRPGRRSEFQPLTIEHLMASSAIPFLFPATPLWVDGRREYFGDGSMRQVSPLSPAMHLGAHKILVVGVGQPQRAGFAGTADTAGVPRLGAIAGHAMASVFHDTLQADVEQAQRVTRTLQQLPREVAGVLPYRSVEVLAVQPTQSVDELAQAHAHELPAGVRRALGGLGAAKGAGGLASYLLFEPGFVGALMALGEHDAMARRDELLAFVTGQAA